MSSAAVSDMIQEEEWTTPLTLRVRHLTRFLYDGSATDSFNEARLCPWTDHGQTCSSFDLHITPSGVVRDYPDFYGNCVAYFDVLAPHERLEVEAISIVNTHMDNRGPAPAVNPPSNLQGNRFHEDYHEFLHASAFVSLEAAVWREAMDALPGGVTDIWLDAVRIGQHIHNTFTYASSSTTVNTKPAEVVRTRMGVCQDFAHVMLAICRTHGIPARYVSGYFLNHLRQPDQNEASHAWVEVYLPGYGWKGYDPTPSHTRVTDTRYVKVAVGRDYKDIVPISGKFSGKGRKETIVEVQVTRQ